MTSPGSPPPLPGRLPATKDPPVVPPAGKTQQEAICQLSFQLSSKSPFGGIISQSDGRVTKCIPARSLQQQGCLIKNELHFHQHIGKIDSQDCIVIILFLKQKGVAWGWAGHRATSAISDERKEVLQLSWENKTNQSARIHPTRLWRPCLYPRIPREEKGRWEGDRLIHFQQ